MRINGFDRQHVPAVVVAASALLLLALPLDLPGGQTIELKPRQTISGPEILLGDIVMDAANLPEGWAGRTVMKAPVASVPAHYSLSTIARALQKYPDMHDVVLRGRPSVTLLREGAPLPPARITEAVEQFVRTCDQWKDVPVDVRLGNTGPTLRVSPGKLGVKVTDYIPRDTLDNYTFRVAASVDGVAEHSFSVDAKVVPMRKVWVTVRPLSRGHTVGTKDLEPRIVTSAAAGTLVPVTETLVGMEVNRAIRADQPVSRHFFIQPLCVKRGELLTVSVVRGTLSVVLRAKALATGRRGERVMCVNERSKRRIMVRLTGHREATLDIPGPAGANG